MLKEHSIYSEICNITKRKPKNIVITKELVDSIIEPKAIDLWAQVIDKPDTNNKNVLNKG